MSTFTRFGQLFWGLLLVLLDLRINGFDLLPDFVGYILIAAACGGLVGLSPHFSTARALAWILAVVAVASLTGFELSGVIGLVYEFLELAIDCGMIWFLLGGVMEFASGRGRPDLSLNASNRRMAYVALMGISALTRVAVQGSRDAATLMLVVFVVFVIPLLVLILHLIYRVRHELATGETAC